MALFQTSFLVHFSVWGMIPNLILVLIFFWILFEDPESSFGVYNAFVAGLFLDIFSSHLIGFNILILVVLATILKLILNKYVRLPFKKS